MHYLEQHAEIIVERGVKEAFGWNFPKFLLEKNKPSRSTSLAVSGLIRTSASASGCTRRIPSCVWVSVVFFAPSRDIGQAGEIVIECFFFARDYYQ